MPKIKIFYGSKKEFNKIIPQNYRTLTDLVYELDKDSKVFKIEVPSNEGNQSKPEERPKFKNFVSSSDEYAGVREHVIINFVNFIAKFDADNLYLHNPPLQISDQIKKLYPQATVIYQEYKELTLENLIELHKNYDKKIVGQKEVKQQLLQSLFPLTLKNRKKPVVLLFYGKSGIGKTETAKYISELLSEPIFRKQFSMFQNNQFSTYLFGGAHYEKSFAKDLLDRQSNVLLLDEFDKAHPSFHNAFYQLFDEGEYEDQNYSLMLEKSIIICTSNYNNLDEIEEHLGSAIFNRFDNIIHFQDLSDEAKLEIGDNLYKSISQDYSVKLNIDIQQRLQRSFIDCDNAREIRRVIEGTLATNEIFTKIK